ncbi:uncharacterized protein EI97DRAFT_436484 [Westerdykella ornata]|uniref:Uncharacterized protein n=1 Tax=Westerdykella ornata TaxID=318751 RepID=A0A6A6J8I4_WESOR|nr:uncharacterized protein EI97DRAFT_436484 [Westerdykella ornata]KAF2272870.1 hypothetical protein EI97DRAFT_436484 [Westerdykella ornata]
MIHLWVHTYLPPETPLASSVGTQEHRSERRVMKSMIFMVNDECILDPGLSSVSSPVIWLL